MAIFDKQFYNKDTVEIYTDGPIEQEFLQLFESQSDIDSYLKKCQQWQAIYHLSHIRSNILSWYPFKDSCTILEIGAGCGAITGMLCDKASSVVSVELSHTRAQILYERHKHRDNLTVIPGNFHEIQYSQQFDYIVVIGALEYAGTYTNGSEPYRAFLKDVSLLLAPGGTLLLAIENRFGIKYFAGSPEDHVDKAFAGISGYAGGSDSGKVRTFTKSELTVLLQKAGYLLNTFYYPMQDYKFPTIIHTSESLGFIRSSYSSGTPQHATMRLFDENAVYQQLTDESVAGYFANSFLVEARLDKEKKLPSPLFVKISNDRNPEYRIITSILKSDSSLFVEKVAENTRAGKHLAKMGTIVEAMTKQGPFTYLNGRIEGEKYIYAFLPGETIEQHWNQDFEHGGIPSVISSLLQFKDFLMQSCHTYAPADIYSPKFQQIFGSDQWQQPMLCQSLSNIDLAPDNLIFSDGQYVVVDYEWVLPMPVPIEYITWRSLSGYYQNNARLRDSIDYSSFCRELQWSDDLVKVFAGWDQSFAQFIGNGDYYYCKLQPVRNAYLCNDSLENESRQLADKIADVLRQKEFAVWEKDSQQDYVQQLVALCDERLGMIHNLNLEINELRQKEQHSSWERDVALAENDRLQKELNVDCMALVHIQEELNKSITEIETQKLQNDHIRWELDVACAENQQLKLQLNVIRYSFFIRITQPLRILKNKLFGDIQKAHYLLTVVGRGMRYLFHFGPIRTGKKIWQRNMERRSMPMPNVPYLDIQNAQAPQAIREEPYTFSILTPLYNTPEAFLKEMIASVQAQTYTNWELCLADGSNKESGHVRDIVQQYVAHDSRIRYSRLHKNMGIALNTVAAYKMATGDYVVLLDHDDILTADALYELANVIDHEPNCDILYSDRAIFSNETRKVLAYHYLPGYSPDYLRCMNYMSHLNAFSRHILELVGFEREGFDGSQDHELLLRCIEGSRKVCHIPKVLYWCRACEGSVALNPQSKLYAYEAGKKALSEHLSRMGYPGTVDFLADLYAYRIRYTLKPAKVSILIPNKDHIEDLEKCVKSIVSLSTYQNYEIIIAENNSEDLATFRYYQSLESDSRIKLLTTGIQSFNFSAVNNLAAQSARGEYLLMLNNDTKVITPSWIEEMLMFAQRQDVGAVGAKLLYPNNTIQHCGLVIGLGGHIASNYGYNKPSSENGYMNTLVLPQNYSAVTAACLMVKKSDYLKVGGLDEENFAVGLNDVDFCLKLRELGLFNVWTPYAQLYHYESATRGSDLYGEKKIRFEAECERLRAKWYQYFTNGDPFDTINFRGW